MLRQKSDFAWAETITRDEVQIEILQLGRANFIRCFLRWIRRITFRMRHEFGRYFRFQNRLQSLAGCRVEFTGRNHPSDQMLNERLRHRNVHVVMGHVITDSVRHPAECKFAEVTRSKDKRMMQICEAKKMRSAFSSLNILEGQIVD